MNDPKSDTEDVLKALRAERKIRKQAEREAANLRVSYSEAQANIKRLTKQLEQETGRATYYERRNRGYANAIRKANETVNSLARVLEERTTSNER